MESARRASEIHKERTGRALRITEAEVSNEEMYEEITDLPSEYRRLNAHLKTGSEDFNRRLLAYMTSQASMRAALQQAVSNGWQDEQPVVDVGFFSPGVLQAAPLPQQYLACNTMMSPQKMNAPSNVYRQTPYLMNPWEMQPGQHSRHVSTGSSQEASLAQQHVNRPDSIWLDNGRRESLPTDVTPRTTHSPTRASKTSGKYLTTTLPGVGPAVGHTNTNDSFQQTAPHSMDQPVAQHQPMRIDIEGLTEPLSITIPLESQRFLASNSYGAAYNIDSPSTISPRHDFTDRRYSYHPNGRTRPASCSSTKSPHMKLSPHIPPSHSSLGQTPSPLWLDSDSNSRPSTSCENVFTHACYGHRGMGPYGTSVEQL